jgi:hypothetical protein
VELAVTLAATRGVGFPRLLACAFLAVALVFVRQSFYGMRIQARPLAVPAMTADASYASHRDK